MKLSETPEIVQTLKQILKEYNYLEYDVKRSKGDVLYVKVTDPNTERDFKICGKIRDQLEKSTNLSFLSLALEVSIQIVMIGQKCGPISP